MRVVGPVKFNALASIKAAFIDLRGWLPEPVPEDGFYEVMPAAAAMSEPFKIRVVAKPSWRQLLRRTIWLMVVAAIVILLLRAIVIMQANRSHHVETPRITTKQSSAAPFKATPSVPANGSNSPEASQSVAASSTNTSLKVANSAQSDASANSAAQESDSPTATQSSASAVQPTPLAIKPVGLTPEIKPPAKTSGPLIISAPTALFVTPVCLNVLSLVTLCLP